MRILSVRTLAIGSIFVLSACNPGFDAAEKNNRQSIASGRDEINQRLAAASENAGDLASAERSYLALVKASGNSKESVTQLAAFYSRHNQSARAVALLEPASAAAPDDMNLLRALANSLISADNPERALILLDGAIASHRNDAYLYNSRGVALDRLSRFSEARESYRKAIALNPSEEVDFKTNLSMSFILSGHYNDAIELLQPLVAQNKATPEARQNLALAYGMKGDMNTAMQIGSKDLTLREMNENVRFYKMLAQNTADRHTRKMSAASTPVNVFPAMAGTPDEGAPLTPAKEPAPPQEAVATARDTSATEEIISPSPRPLHSKPRRAIPEEQPPEPGSEETAPQDPAPRQAAAAPSPSKTATSTATPASQAVAPLPVLKPDKW